MRSRVLEPIEAMRHHVREASRIAPGRPALWIGLRMAAAMALPLLLSPWLEPATATSASLAGYLITLVDKGGAYRTRARAMAAASVGAVTAVIVGVIVAHTAFAAPVVILGFTACAFAHVWGPSGASIANPIAVLLAIACFRPGPGATLVQAIVGTGLGACWAMLLALILWPVRVYQPGRRALANVLDELAAYASAIATTTDRSTPVARHRIMRDQLEVARKTLVATRRGHAERDLGERLLALVHVADQTLGKLLALEELLDGLEDREDTARAARALHAHAAALSRLADLVVVEHPSIEELKEIAVQATAVQVTSCTNQQLGLILTAVAEHVALTSRVIASLADPEPPKGIASAATPLPRARLRDAFDLDSAVLRHALRVALSSAVAFAIAALVHLAYGYWILITVYLLLQPHRTATTTRAIQRGFGTVGGAIVAALLVALIHEQGVLIAITVAFAAIGAAVVHLNYGVFSLFVTPTFVLLAELQTQDFTLVRVRVAYTLLGGALAFLATALLWPARERARFDELMADAIDHAANYLAAVRQGIASGTPMPAPEIATARRLFGIALGNAELALDRMVVDRDPTHVVEPRMSALAIARRLGGAINVLGTTRSLATPAEQSALVAQAHILEARLEGVARAMRGGRMPVPTTTPPDESVLPPMQRRLTRYVESLAALQMTSG